MASLERIQSARRARYSGAPVLSTEEKGIPKTVSTAQKTAPVLESREDEERLRLSAHFPVRKNGLAKDGEKRVRSKLAALGKVLRSKKLHRLEAQELGTYFSHCSQALKAGKIFSPKPVRGDIDSMFADLEKIRRMIVTKLSHMPDTPSGPFAGNICNKKRLYQRISDAADALEEALHALGLTPSASEPGLTAFTTGPGAAGGLRSCAKDDTSLPVLPDYMDVWLEHLDGQIAEIVLIGEKTGAAALRYNTGPATDLGACVTKTAEAKRVAKEPELAPLSRPVAKATAAETAPKRDFSPAVAADAFPLRRHLEVKPDSCSDSCSESRSQSHSRSRSRSDPATDHSGPALSGSQMHAPQTAPKQNGDAHGSE